MKLRLRLALLSLALLANPVTSAQPPSATEPTITNSSLDGGMFYQLLLGELQVRQGFAGAGLSLILDAARKTRDPAVFQRAVDIALQARSGQAALQAAQAWKRSIADSPEANRYILQILLALNQVEDAGQALAVALDELPDSEKPAAIASVVRVFARVPDKALAAKVVEKALARSLKQTHLQATAWTTIGRMHREAQHWPAAIEATLQAYASDPQAPGPLLLGLSLLSTGSPEIRKMLDQAMQGPQPADLRLGYARTLLALQSPQDALHQLQQLTTQHPGFAPGWLLLGLLEMDLGNHLQAQRSLLHHVALVKDSVEPEQQAGLTEALIALSTLAQQRSDWSQANQWLSQIPASANPVRLAVRRAELLKQQGRLDEARLVLTQVQPVSDEQARDKALALSRWLREHQQAQQALAVLEQALAKAADDFELLTEQSLVFEKLRRYADMEHVLRQLMQRRPQDPHAYNALGYSLADRGLRLEEAKALILKAVELAPQDPFIQDSLGWVAFRMGNHDEALRILRAAYQAKPDAEIAAHLGEVLWRLDRRSEAASVWREGLLIKADNETLVETMKRLGFQP